MKSNIAFLGIIGFVMLLVLGTYIFTRYKLLQKSRQNFSSPYGDTVVGAEKDEHIRVLFAGDFMFDRYIRQIARQSGNDYILSDLKGFLLDKDLVVVNLEGPITDYDSASIGSKVGSKENFIFTFDSNIAKTLYDHNIRLVNIGNNHILNFGVEGLEMTKKYLAQSGVDYFGIVNKTERRYVVKNVGGVKIGFVNYNHFFPDCFEITREDINYAGRESDIVVLYTHWGQEYIKEVSQDIVNKAHEFIDMGVDLIIGSHPHVVKQKEIYKGRAIYYSLGNFVMDQYFSEDTRTGLLVNAVINTESMQMEFEERKIYLENDGRSVFLEN